MDPRLTPDAPWPEGYVQLTTAEAKEAILLGLHPGTRSFKVDTGLIDLLNQGHAVCARAPNYRLVFRPSLAAPPSEGLDPRLAEGMKMQPSVRGAERARLVKRLGELETELAENETKRAEIEERIARSEAFLRGGEEDA